MADDVALSITCPVCGRTSWHPEDVAHGYCGACREVTGGAVTRPCDRCDSCGQVANSDDQEPWTVWLDLPLRSAAAVLIGLVRPIPCPACQGAKRVPA
jgi:hypothetical protein